MKERVKVRSQTSGRSDDNAAAMEKRLKTFNDSNKEVVDHLSGNFLREVTSTPEVVNFQKANSA